VPGREPYGYIGNESDRATALDDFHARLYRPDFGTFLAPDPVAVFQAEKTLLKPRLGWAYAYASGSPVTQSDRNGKEPPAFNSSDAATKRIVDRFGPQLDEATKRAIEQGQLEGTKLAIEIWLTVDSGLALGEGAVAAYEALRSGQLLAKTVEMYRAVRIGEGLAAARGALGRLWGRVFGREAAEVAGPGGKIVAATDPKAAILLSKQLASEGQLGEMVAHVGRPIAGPGTTKGFGDSARIAKTYGGNSADWAKMSSSGFRAADGTTFATHWVENLVTGQQVEAKVVIDVFGGP